MEQNETQSVQMTPQEKAEWEAFKARQAKEAAERKAAEDRAAYADLVDKAVASSTKLLRTLSDKLVLGKERVFNDFHDILQMKAELFADKVRNNQKTHTFTNSEGTARITLGQYYNDGWRDTVEEGIQMVQDYISSLAQTEETRALVSMVLQLLARDAKGNLNARRIIQLHKTADEIGDPKLKEGVKIIEEAYQPQVSKQFIRVETKGERGEWFNLPLGITEA